MSLLDSRNFCAMQCNIIFLTLRDNKINRFGHTTPQSSEGELKENYPARRFACLCADRQNSYRTDLANGGLDSSWAISSAGGSESNSVSSSPYATSHSIASVVASSSIHLSSSSRTSLRLLFALDSSESCIPRRALREHLSKYLGSIIGAEGLSEAGHAAQVT